MTSPNPWDSQKKKKNGRTFLEHGKMSELCRSVFKPQHVEESMMEKDSGLFPREGTSLIPPNKIKPQDKF